MNVFNAIPEPWAKIVAVVATIGLGVLSFFLIEPSFGIGVACGGCICMVIYWGARLDERPFWQHVLGRSVVYPESQRNEETDQTPAPDQPRD